MLKGNAIAKAIFFACILLAVVIVLFEVTSRNSIRQDVEEKISFMNQGNMNWTILSGVDVAPELLSIVSSSNNENEDLSCKFIKNNEIIYKLGFVFPWGCKVTYSFNGYDFVGFINYCEENSITDYSGMIEAFDAYKDSNGKNYSSNVSMKYKRVEGKWSCDYNDEAFLNSVSCGMLEQYTDYYNQSISNIQRFIEEVGNEE